MTALPPDREYPRQELAGHAPVQARPPADTKPKKEFSDVKKIPLIFLLISTALVLHPATRARLQNILDLAGALQSELRSAFVDAPIAKARVEYRAEAERQAREQAEIRMKQIDKAVERAVQGSDN